MVTMRTTSPGLRWTSMIRHRHYSVGGQEGATMTMSPTVWFVDFLNYFCRPCNVDKYSHDHFFLNDWWHCRMSCHRFNRLIWISVVTSSGMAWIDCSIKKWPGVNAIRSCGSVEFYVIGLELKIPLIRVVKVWTSSNINTVGTCELKTWRF